MPEPDVPAPDFVGSAAQQVALAEAEIPHVTQDQARRTDITVLTAREQAGSRRVITGVVGASYAIALLLLGGLAIGTAWSGDIATARTFAFEILKIGILPIVTLVLGYYMARPGQ